MIFLQLIFLGIGVYGVAVGHLGAALLAVVMVVFLMIAARIFEQQDRAWLADQQRATKPSTTRDDLSSYECEAARNDSLP